MSLPADGRTRRNARLLRGVGVGILLAALAVSLTLARGSVGVLVELLLVALLVYAVVSWLVRETGVVTFP